MSCSGRVGCSEITHKRFNPLLKAVQDILSIEGGKLTSRFNSYKRSSGPPGRTTSGKGQDGDSSQAFHFSGQIASLPYQISLSAMTCFNVTNTMKLSLLYTVVFLDKCGFARYTEKFVQGYLHIFSRLANSDVNICEVVSGLHRWRVTDIYTYLPPLDQESIA